MQRTVKTERCYDYFQTILLVVRLLTHIHLWLMSRVDPPVTGQRQMLTIGRSAHFSLQ